MMRPFVPLINDTYVEQLLIRKTKLMAQEIELGLDTFGDIPSWSGWTTAKPRASHPKRGG